MGRRSDHSREELEALIVVEGSRLLANTGFARFSAREVAKRIGYSIGTIYNVFGSLDQLMLAMNSRTFLDWAAAVEARLEKAEGEDRIAVLVAGYFDFAAANRNRWMAIYDHRLPLGEPLPARYTAQRGVLYNLLETEIAHALPAVPAPELAALARSLVAVVHGHCLFALNGTFALLGEPDPQAAALARVRDALRATSAAY